MREAARPTLSHPARAEKIRKAKIGKSRAPESSRASGRAHLGKKASQESRRRMSEAHRDRGTGGAKPSRPWTGEEDEAVRALTPHKAARATGRTIKAVWERRKKPRVNPTD